MKDVLRAAHDLLRLYAGCSEPDRKLIDASMRPTRADAELVFDRDLARDMALQQNVTEGWSASWPAVGRAVSIRLAARSVEQLQRGQLGLFPEGYRKVAPRLRPGAVWLAFELVEPALRFDGLAHLNGRFLFFPKPWKAWAGAAARAVEHWAA